MKKKYSLVDLCFKLKVKNVASNSEVRLVVVLAKFNIAWLITMKHSTQRAGAFFFRIS